MEKGDIVVFRDKLYRVLKVEREITSFRGITVTRYYILQRHGGHRWKATPVYFDSIKKLKLHEKDI